jgi:integrase
VDFEKGLITIPGEKSATSHRTIPMIPALRQLLERLHAERKPKPEDSIFRVHEAQKALTSAAEKAGCHRMTHHDLRHFFATLCIESGVDIPTISRWLGHADGGALAMRTYGHLRQEHSVEAAKKVRI